MSNSRKAKALLQTSVILLLAASAASVRAFDRDDRDDRSSTLIVTMTNDAMSNAIRVYDASSQRLLQTVSTRGKGGVGGNARGVRASSEGLVAVVNNESNTVAVFERDGSRLSFQQLVATTSAPVSVDFGNDHMYVAGVNTVDSFPIRHGRIEGRDGSTVLVLADGSTPPEGSTAQVGVLNARALLVTLKTDPVPGTVDIVRLDGDGSVRNDTPRGVSAPVNSLTPFGFSVLPDGTAVITLAHSSEDGLFRDGGFVDVVSSGQAAPCWTTRVGKYVFTANTGAKTVSRLISTGGNIFIDDPVAAAITAGGSPSDIDADGGVMAVLDRGDGASHLSLFTYNTFGELTAAGHPISIGVPGANGVAIVTAPERDGR